MEKHKANTKYLNYFISSKCAVDLCLLKVFPNAKEITESFGCYEAVRKHLLHKCSLNNKNIVLVSVGDGRTPRTSSTFAFKSAWDCIGVDPALKHLHKYKSVNRLTLYDCKGEDLPLDKTENKQTIIVGVHAHGPFRKIVERIAYCSEIIGVVAIPCCYDMSLWREPDIKYKDLAILSGKNEVHIWS